MKTKSVLKRSSAPNSTLVRATDKMIHFNRLDHILITIPEGATPAAHDFYTKVLGLTELPGGHPHGAIWFAIADCQLHIREEVGGNVSARHPAFEVADLADAREELTQKGVTISYSAEIDGR